LARKGTPIPQNDIWMAALSIQCGLPLATTDQHFQHIDGLTLLLW
jgi:tRNA(fMet)-specific endonuclease VapC